MPKPRAAIPSATEVVSTGTPRGRADRLFRDAVECLRQRERYSRLVDAGAHDEEQSAALKVVCLCDKVLLDSMRDYEQAATDGPSAKPEDWWHKANSLWHATREYERHHHDCDKTARQFTGSHSASKLGQLTLQYDLEASALLALRLAIASYGTCCPDAQLYDRPQTFVA